MSEDELRTEVALLRDAVHTGFARMDRYFELQQAQHIELRGEVRELRGEMQDLRADVQHLTRRVDRIEERRAYRSTGYSVRLQSTYDPSYSRTS